MLNKTFLLILFLTTCCSVYANGSEAKSITATPVEIGQGGAQLPEAKPVDVTREEAKPSAWLFWFYWLCDALRFIVLKVYSLIGNWGIVFIALALLFRGALLPLSIANMRFQAHQKKVMRKIKPEIARIKEEYQKKPLKRDEKIMALYKENNIWGVAQLKGCMPLFIQLPILFCMFKVLLSLEPLQGATFLWITDLSKPDALFHFASGLPYFGDSFNLLPILLFIPQGVMAYLQKSEDSTKSIYIMPIAISLCFYSFPAGVLIYFATGSFIQLAETYVFNRYMVGV